LIESLRSACLEEIQQGLKLAGRLEQDRKDLEAFKSDLPEALLEKIDEAAQRLRASANELREFVTRHKLNTNFFLAWLLDSVKESAGGPKYLEVSTLLQYAYAAYGQPMPIIGEEALRKTYTRFKKENPYAGLLTDDGKRNLLFGVVIWAIVSAFASDIPFEQIFTRVPLEQLSTPPPANQTDDNSSFRDKLSRIFDDESVRTKSPLPED
jgi:hypothetical protein